MQRTSQNQSRKTSPWESARKFRSRLRRVFPFLPSCSRQIMGPFVYPYKLALFFQTNNRSHYFRRGRKSCAFTFFLLSSFSFYSSLTHQTKQKKRWYLRNLKVCYVTHSYFYQLLCSTQMHRQKSPPTIEHLGQNVRLSVSQKREYMHVCYSKQKKKERGKKAIIFERERGQKIVWVREG